MQPLDKWDFYFLAILSILLSLSILWFCDGWRTADQAVVVAQAEEIEALVRRLVALERIAHEAPGWLDEEMKGVK